MPRSELEPRFVEFIPHPLEENVLYVSMQYATASHLCACGCGNRVVTPLGRADWVLTFDGTVTMSPSVGNGQSACGSHYMIRQNKVVWCRPMTRTAARAVHATDSAQRAKALGEPVQTRLVFRLSRWMKNALRRF